MVRNIGLAITQARGDLRRKNVSEKGFRMLFLLLDASQVLAFQRPQRALAQLGRDPGAQDGRIEGLGQIIVGTHLETLRDPFGVRIGA